MKGAVHQAEIQCAGDGGAEKERGWGEERRGKEKRKCVDEEERARGVL